DLATRLRDKETLARNAARRVEVLADQLSDEEAKSKKLQASLDSYRTQLATAETNVKNLEAITSNQKRDLTDANRSLGTLERDKQALAAQASRALAAVENRFEGIALTGRRVVFLVDMSGSMDLVD